MHSSIMQQILLSPMLDATKMYLVKAGNINPFYSQDAEILVKNLVKLI